MGRIPDRWKEYSGCGKPIKGVPVFAFKTPLAKKYSHQNDPGQEFVEEGNEFTPDSLLKFVAELEYEVAVVIDLTNTFRYYNGLEEFGKKHNIQYEKVKCEGQKIPNDSVMERVATIVSDVIHLHGKDSKKIVGIHCTHGVNRTGYLVARYMIEWLGYQPKDAIEAFNVARGHAIEREAYLEDLNDRKPEERFVAWQKERSIVDSVRGAVDPMNLWTDFDDDAKQSPDVINDGGDDDNVKKNNDTYNQPYNQQYRGHGNNRNHNNQYWRGFHNRQRPYYRAHDPMGNPYQ